MGLLLVVTTTVIVAAEPSNPGPFTGCLTMKGIKGLVYNVAVSATTPQAPCLTGDTLITFSNGKGPAGPAGPAGLSARRATLARRAKPAKPVPPEKG